MNELALLLRWALLILGAVYFLTESAIFASIRVEFARRSALLGVFVYCARCTGFWLGLALASWTWPFGVIEAPRWFQIIEGGVAAMALGAIWSAWRGGNPAWTAEEPLHHDHPQTEEAR